MIMVYILYKNYLASYTSIQEYVTMCLYVCVMLNYIYFTILFLNLIILYHIIVLNTFSLTIHLFNAFFIREVFLRSSTLVLNTLLLNIIVSVTAAATGIKWVSVAFADVWILQQQCYTKHIRVSLLTSKTYLHINLFENIPIIVMIIFVLLFIVNIIYAVWF